MNYHAIGDSNAIYNFFHLPQFVEHHLGSVRMRDIADGVTPLDLPVLGVKPGDACFFCAGEIDVRSDFHKITLASGDADGMIAVLVRRYVEVLQRNAIEGVPVWIVAVLPTAYAGIAPDWIRDHPLYPYIGPDEARAAYTVTMNRELQMQASVAGFNYLDIYRRYADERGMMRMGLSSHMHVADNRPVLAELYKQGMYPDGVDIAAATELVDLAPSLARVTERYQ